MSAAERIVSIATTRMEALRRHIEHDISQFATMLDTEIECVIEDIRCEVMIEFEKMRNALQDQTTAAINLDASPLNNEEHFDATGKAHDEDLQEQIFLAAMAEPENNPFDFYVDPSLHNDDRELEDGSSDDQPFSKQQTVGGNKSGEPETEVNNESGAPQTNEHINITTRNSERFVGEQLHKGIAVKCVADGENSIEQEVAAISHLEERTSEEDAILPDVLHSFHCHMKKEDPAKAKTHSSYVRVLKQLMIEHKRSVASMASEEYLLLVKGFPRNKISYYKLSASVKAFRTFMEQRAPGSHWETAPQGDKFYMVEESKKLWEEGAPGSLGRTLNETLHGQLEAKAWKRGDAFCNAEVNQFLHPTVEEIYTEHLVDGERRGDYSFRHPFVLCLLDEARERVSEALAENVRTHGDNWMICIRTYGRAGNPGRGDWERRVRSAGKGVLQLTMAALERALGPDAHSRCLVFVSHEDKDFTSGRLGASLCGTPWEKRVVVGVKGADLQVRFIEMSFPCDTHVVVVDDNIVNFVAAGSDPSHTGLRILEGCVDNNELVGLITRAGKAMALQGANVWSVNGSCNSRTLFQTKEMLQRNQKKHGPAFPEFSQKLGLIYGACFGFKVLHDPSRYTRFGQVKDDVERSLRYWHKDKVILRFKQYGVQKTHPPGKFNARKGGISANATAEKHKAEETRALTCILDEFASAYARLPRSGERAPCGLLWTPARQDAPARRYQKRKIQDVGRDDEDKAGRESEDTAMMGSETSGTSECDLL